MTLSSDHSQAGSLHPFKIDWQQTDAEVRVTVMSRFPAADKRHLAIDYDINQDYGIVTLRCRLESSGKQYRHLSMLRGFCVIPNIEFKEMDPQSCDWRAELI